MIKEENCFKLLIRRKNSLVGLFLKTKILINGEILKKVSNGNCVEFELHKKFTQIKLYNKITLGKDICKEFVIDPMNNSEVIVFFYYKMNWISLIPPLMYFLPPSTIITDIKYIP